MLVTQFAPIAEVSPHVIAIHFAAAGEFTRAAAEWGRAGALAVKLSAYAEAMEHFAKALDTNKLAEPSRERDEIEIAYRLDLVSATIAARGYTAEGLTEQMEQAIGLGRKLGQNANLVPALSARCILLGSNGALKASWDLAREIRAASESGSDVDRLLGHRVLGTLSIFCGDLRGALLELEAFMSLYDPGRHEAELRRVGPSSQAISSMTGLAELHTLFGNFAAAEHWRTRAMAAAREQGEMHQVCFAVAFVGCLLAAVRNADDELARYATELLGLSRSADLPYWRGHGELFCGLAMIRQGREEEGFTQARDGVTKLVASRAYVNAWFILYAEACEHAGRLSEAAKVLDHAKSSVERGELWFASEYHRLRARLTLASGDRARAAEEFETALEIATAQGATLFADRARRGLEEAMRPAWRP